MDYYKILNFEMEPFSNSPDPDFFYSSAQHFEALQQLTISIHLKRGLSVITGDIGTGKTTISRQLIQKISKDDSIKFFLVLDPGFSSPILFLKYLLHLFEPEKKYESNDEHALKENIKEYLFIYGVDKNINIVIIIDEGQKLSLPCIEILRELLNFETNDQKLLQIIIFAQKEFNQSIEQIANFKDRINFYYQLNPLNFKESKNFINYRLEKCFIQGKNSSLFTPFGYFLIYMATKGFPRKIVTLCHQIMLSLIIKNKTKADFLFVLSCIKKVSPPKKMVRHSLLFVVSLILIIGSLYVINGNKIIPISDQFSYFDQKHRESKKSKPPLKTEEPFDKMEIKNLNLSDSDPEANPEANPSIKQDIEPSIKPEINSSINKPETSGEKSQAAFKKSDIYGTIKVPENATLASMMRIIYGSFKYSYLNQLIKHNSNLNDPNEVKGGMDINFPVIESSNYFDDEQIFIILFETDNFEKSFITANNYQTSVLNVRILPILRNDKEFFFPVVINKPFLSMAAAEKYKKSLPEIIFFIAECKPVSQMKNNVKKQKG